MNNENLTEFKVDQENKKINVNKLFSAPVRDVWKAWTTQEFLDQWWAPKPWETRTKTMEFNEGGAWVYAMVGPEGNEHWSRVDYATITSEERFTAQEGFTDRNGNLNKEFPRAGWTVNFSEANGSTMVYVEIEHEKFSDIEAMIQMGFKEGFTAALSNLERLLNR